MQQFIDINTSIGATHKRFKFEMNAQTRTDSNKNPQQSLGGRARPVNAHGYNVAQQTGEAEQRPKQTGQIAGEVRAGLVRDQRHVQRCVRAIFGLVRFETEI